MLALSEWLLVVITAAAVALVVIIARLANQIGQTLASVRQTSDKVGDLAPRVERVLSELEVELQELQGVTSRANQIVGEVQHVTGEFGRATLDVLNIVRFLDVTRRARAAMAGAKAGVALLKDAVVRR